MTAGWVSASSQPYSTYARSENRKAAPPMTPTSDQVIPTPDQVLEALRPVHDPELHRSIVDLDMVRKTEIATDGRAHVQIALTVAGCPLRGEITQRVTSALMAVPGITSVGIDFTVMTDDERAALRERLHGDPSTTAGSQPAQGHATGREVPFARPDSRTRALLISSGKGGVGKSSVTANVAVALAQRGHSVAKSRHRIVAADRVRPGRRIPAHAAGARALRNRCASTRIQEIPRRRV